MHRIYTTHVLTCVARCYVVWCACKYLMNPKCSSTSTFLEEHIYTYSWHRSVLNLRILENLEPSTGVTTLVVRVTISTFITGKAALAIWRCRCLCLKLLVSSYYCRCLKNMYSRCRSSYYGIAHHPHKSFHRIISFKSL